MLKHIAYERSSSGFICQVTYLMLGDKCVFTACQHAYHASTINYAEQIALAIEMAEGRPSENLRFFDIQTRTSYGECSIHRPNPGDFVFDEVVMGHEETSWRPTICPERIAAIFKDYIDGEPHQVLYHGMENAAKVEFKIPV